MPSELETICLKCLEKSAAARYDTARSLAEDLTRYLDDVPIIAKRSGAVRRVIKFVKRRKTTAITVVAAVMLSVAGALALSFRHASRLATQREKIAVADAHQGQVDRWVSVGNDLILRDDWQGASDAFSNALELDSSSVEALANFARLKKEWYTDISHLPPPRSKFYRIFARSQNRTTIPPIMSPFER